ncbi:protein mini spindles isoform X2 [Phlebotomus argentipes]|uniref:protein mini spindles isoform X2 n=1 Tax=Phlebotomus argentipes TaxID=94469 RepID=UPI0028932214|nr:protein mini spindles isoform X2 [Phlebotomus argentipes]
MEEDTEFKKLPVDERCVHKLWKARVDGYEEATKIFREIVDEKSPEWNKFLGLVKKFVVDSNVMAQEKGLEATLVFVENCGFAGKTVGEVMSGIVSKCIGAPKAKTKDLAIQISLMYIEIEKHEIVMEELIKGMENKNPKIGAACIATTTTALREFGSKVIAVKPIVKKIATLLSDRDKNVRDEAKSLTIEIYRWIGAALKAQLTSVADVLMKELEGEFDKMKNEKPEPTRYLRSQQERAAAVAAAAAHRDDADDGEEGDEANASGEIDPLDLMDPVDILSKIPKDFYDKLESKKWQERKEALEALEPLVQNPKLESGDYAEVVKALKKVLTKDTNVVLVALSGKCLAGLAKGLGKKFSPYALVCTAAILEKFKEKKTNVVTALRDAIDAIYPATNLDAIQEDILEALNNKNPNVKSETASFLARAFTKTLPTVLNKKLLKAYLTALLKTLNESDPVVRDASAEAIGTAMKLIGEKNISPFLTDVDALKLNKIKECCEKAVIVIKISSPKKERPATAPQKSAGVTKGGSTEPKPVTRPATAGGKKPVAKKVGGGLAKSGSTAKVVGKTLPSERDLSQEEVDEKASEVLPPDLIAGLSDSNWKARLSAMESLTALVHDMDPKSGMSQVLVRTVLKKPGLKDTHFQVLKYRLDIIRVIAERMPITVTTCDYALNDITEKLGDTKNSASAAAALTAIAEAINLDYVVSKVTTFAFEQKSPKVQQESLLWINQALREFGLQINPKMLLEDARKAVQSINPAVRGAGITLLGTMYLFMGKSLEMVFDGEKPALRQQIFAEFEKNTDQRPPVPMRGVKKSSSKGSISDNEEDGDDNQEVAMPQTTDLLPRIDISSQITDALLGEMADKNWKTRNEGLIKLQGIIGDAKLIKPSIGDLPQALAHRIVDSNAKIAQMAVAICEQLATAMGPACKQHVRVLFPGFLHGLGDMKSFLRNACLACINTWGDTCGYKEFFDGEMIAEALKSGGPGLKTELWGWLAEKLGDLPVKSISRDELVACLPHLYASICDRNAEVRKNANDAVLGIMIHVGYETMIKALDKQKPASKKDIQAALDKARPNLPVKPLAKGKQQAPIPEEPVKTVRGGGQKVGQKSAGMTNKAPATTSSRKKEEDVDTSPLLAINNTKNQRLIDEQKLKVLKWTFTQPREEFTELLRDQMTTANVNKGLMANMFHDDFRYHLKVIDSLIEDLPSNEKALICNLDLILKWLSLRFYDTNPSVLLKGLEYLSLVFQVLIDNEYMMADSEGSCFIPHLLIKIGDPKDAVRNGVRSLLRQICLVYPFSKLSTYIMEGLKSKNARQRTECLDELGYLIETHGLTVCQPTPQAALKEIARHISDRDNSVRNAALNCIVQAYFLAGDRVYKMIGQISDKDSSMLDERIKRMKKTRVMKPVESAPGKPQIQHQQQEIVEPQELPCEEELPPEEEAPQPIRTFESLPPKPSGPFRLDPDVIAEIEKDWVKVDQMPLRDPSKIDVAFLESPLQIVTRDGVGYPMDKLQKLMDAASAMSTGAGMYSNYTMSPPQSQQPSRVSSSYSPQRNQSMPAVSSNLADTLPKLDPNLVKIIRAVGSPDSLTARAAIHELGDIINNPEQQAVLRDYEELYIQSILKQYQNLSQLPIAESMVMCQPLLSSMYSFFNSKQLGKNLSVMNVKNVMSMLLGLMTDQKLANSGDGNYMRVLNGICLKILDRTNFTNQNCALIRLLKETCSSTGLPKFTDLLMKCIWRNVKVIPERSSELDYDAVLLELHDFMVALPSAWWHQRPSDTPLRTIKTIIHNMAKIKGNAILQHLNKIPSHSELYTYLIRILKKDGGSSGNPTNGNSNLVSPQRGSQQGSVKDQKQRLTKQTHDTISCIFKLISDTQTSKEGIAKLYDFKLMNPEVDVVPFLKGASPTFQKYIEDGLAEIERQRSGSEGDNITQTMTPATDSNVNNFNSDYWLDKLNTMVVKSRGAAASTNYDASSVMDNKTADENLNVNQQFGGKSTVSLLKKDMNPEPISSNRLELLQQKLAQIRQPK